jgi:hypothetical protein
MADVFGMETYGASPDAGHSGTAVPGTGDLRRRYNFGDRISELSIAQDPFFRFVSQVAKKPTDDPQFKFTEQRHSYHKRYAYVVGYNNGSANVFTEAELKTTSDAALGTSAGDKVKLLMATDYKSGGNLGSIIGNSSNDILVGESTETNPAFLLPDGVLKVNMSSTDGGGMASGAAVTANDVDEYILVRIDQVHAASSASVTHADLSDGAAEDGGARTSHFIPISGTVVKPISSTSFKYLASYCGDDPIGTVYSANIANVLEGARSYVVGSAHAQGSGYPESWKDQPFSSAVGLTQIFKTAMAMDNTTRATVLKYEPNEFARIWRTKLIEHKFDIEQSLLFGSQATVDGVQYTEGAVSFITSYGNIFDGSGIGGTGDKSQDDFLDDMSQFLDPRYNNASATLFMCSTDTYNWMHKLSGYFTANVKKTDAGSTNHFAARADFSIAGRKGVYGLDVTQVYTPYGIMNLVRNVHLDGSPVKILAINMSQCAYRPLVGNGLNRDTAVYVGVQTLENSGVDRRVDLIQTEAGMEWRMPEAHAVWK